MASTRENLSSGFANNKGADQPVHPHSLLGSFVIRLLERIIASLCSWAEWFESHFVRNPEDRFCRVESEMYIVSISLC